MSKEKEREILQNINKLPEDKKEYLFGYMEGIRQMSEKMSKESEDKEN